MDHIVLREVFNSDHSRPQVLALVMVLVGEDQSELLTVVLLDVSELLLEQFAGK